MSEKEAKKCPECGRELEKGYIIPDGIGSIRWSPKAHKFFGRGELVLRGSAWALQNVKAYRCTSCKLILFRYGKARGRVEES